MKRNQKIKLLQNSGPSLTNVTFSQDMGYEFSAVVPTGVIYAEPGMLLNYSDGAWPPDGWEKEPAKIYEQLLNEFLLADEWTVITWRKLSDEELDQWLEDVEGFQESAS